MHLDRSPVAVGHDTVRSVSKLLLGAASLVFVLYLVTLLPGVDRLVPRTPVTFAAVVSAVATAVLAGLLLYAAPKLALLTRLTLAGPRAVVGNVASVAYWLAVLAAVLVAHRGLAGVVTPFVDGGLYDLGFLLLALPAVVTVAARLYAALDPGADALADRLAGDAAGDGEATADAAPDGDADGDAT
ncbi:hypothetical protein [Halostella litorea]|uniref:hypothetical protein n=1 Tax=Halostella litorea TaxID=2528831 RepID=UPI001091DC52|nr:hypothetical protein [Halostella litorea]